MGTQGTSRCTLFCLSVVVACGSVVTACGSVESAGGAENPRSGANDGSGAQSQTLGERRPGEQNSAQGGGAESTSDAQESTQVQELFRLTNTARTAQGLAPLTRLEALATAAQAHAEDMGQRGFFSHTNPEGLSPFERLRALGYKNYNLSGENIACGQTSPEHAMQSWMQSAGHKANILNATYTALGVGFARGASGRCTTLWVQVFSKP